VGRTFGDHCAFVGLVGLKALGYLAGVIPAEVANAPDPIVRLERYLTRMKTGWREQCEALWGVISRRVVIAVSGAEPQWQSHAPHICRGDEPPQERGFTSVPLCTDESPERR
jgi:hypothetical protein